MRRGDELYRGKAKTVYRTDDPDIVVMEFRDSATAFDGAKKGTIQDKGICNARISAALFRYLEDAGIPTHFVDLTGDREMVVKSLQIIPVEVVARNVVAGSLAKRVGLEEGTDLQEPVLEFYFKDDDLGDPMINLYHIRSLRLATDDEMREIEGMSLRVNELLYRFMKERGLILVDFKLEFGRHKGRILLGDEISPDTCRFWDAGTREKLDKDRFRRDLGGVAEAYQEVLRRVTGKGL